MASTVTLDRAYLETLLRRAEYHVSPDASTTPLDTDTVTILKIDHENLLRLAQEYAALRSALLSGGITNEALEILISGGEPDPVPAAQYQDANLMDSGPTFDYQPHNVAIDTVGPSFDPPTSYPTSHWQPRENYGDGMARDSWRRLDHQLTSPHEDNSFFSEPAAPDDSHPLSPNPVRPSYARAEQRSIAIKNLSDRVTHSDIAGILRGGLVLDLYLRAHEKIASVSFVEGAAAAAFMNHVKRNDIYLHGKRLEIAWNDRQFILPGHVAGKINNGATRNLVIRGVNPSITADRIREDLDHIHNLVVIDVTFDRGDAFISLNSIHNSLYARPCMMSRAAYKGSRIEFYPDECDQPLPKILNTPKKAPKSAEVKKAPTMLNRFQMLNMDGSTDGSSTTGDDGLQEFPTIHTHNDWSNEGVAV